MARKETGGVFRDNCGLELNPFYPRSTNQHELLMRDIVRNDDVCAVRSTAARNLLLALVNNLRRARI